MRFSFVIALLLFVFSAGFVFAQESGGVKGKIRNMGGSVIGEATITARQDGKDIKSAQSDNKGNFQMNGLAPGVYNFVFEKTGYETGIKYNVEIEKKKTRDLGGNLILSIDKGTQVIIKGLVFDETGRSVSGANIEIEKKQTDGSFRKISQTTSSYGSDVLTPGEFGFRFRDGAADYRITASLKGVSANQELSVTSAAVYRLALTLKVQK